MCEKECEWATEEEKLAEFRRTTLPGPKISDQEIFLVGNYTRHEYWNYIRFMWGDNYMGN